MSNILLCCCLILTVLGTGSTQTVDKEPLNEQSVLECTISDELDKVIADLDGGAKDVWDIDEDKMVVRVTKESKDAIIGTQGVSCEVVIEDVDKYLEENMAKEQPKRNTRDDSMGRIQAYDFASYLSYAEIMTFYDDEIIAKCNNLATKTDIGGTFKKKRMYAIRITATTPPGDDDPPTPKIYLQCLIHGREWISGPPCMYIAKTLCEEYNKEEGDKDVKELMNTMEFVIVPVVNPDGYEYTQEPPDDKPNPAEPDRNKRLWRKNVDSTQSSYCEGADLNRNFDYHWNEKSPHVNENANKAQCDYQYPGRAAASEMETQNIVKLMTGLGNILAAVDFHSYSQFIIRPFVFVNRKAPDNNVMYQMSKQMKSKIYEVNHKTYKTKKGYEVDRQISGVFMDWAYDGAIKTTNGPRIASFTFELRPTKNGNPGFLLPANEILPTCQEIFPAIVYLAKTIKASPLPAYQAPAADPNQ